MTTNKVLPDNSHEISSTFLYQLIFDIKHFIFKTGNATKLLFSIYDDTEKKIITEEYCLDLDENNFPAIGSPDDCKVLFKNLSYNILQHNIFIICRIYRIGPMEAPDVLRSKRKKRPKKRKHTECLRPYGASVIKLKDFMDNIFSIRIISAYVRIAQNTLNLNILYKHIPELIIFVIMSYYNGKGFKSVIKFGAQVMFNPDTQPIYCPKQEHRFNDLPFDVMQQKKEKYWDHHRQESRNALTYYTPPLSIGIVYGLTLYHGNISVVKNKYKFYDKLTEIETLCMYPLLNIERHILYLTIKDIHVSQRNKCAACNVCIKMELRDNNTYNRIPNVFAFGKQKFELLENETKSIVYYHTNDPVINQTYRVLLPLDITILQNCHLYFSCWHVSAGRKRPDPRGFTYIKLYNDTLNRFIGKQMYELELYREAEGRYLHETKRKLENKLINVYFQLESTKL